MRTLMLFTAGFAAACALGAWLGLGIWWTTVLITALGMGALCLLFRGKHLLLPRMAALSLGLCAGLGCFFLHGKFVLAPAAALDGKTEAVSFLATRESYSSGYGIGVQGLVKIQGRNYKVKLYLHEEDLTLSPGDRVEGDFTFRLTAEGGLSQPTYHRSDGIFLLGYQADTVTVSRGTGTEVASWSGLWHSKLTKVLNRSAPEDAAPFLRALLLGDRSDLGYDVQSDFKVTGISHVVAVSGLHVSVLFSLVQLVTRKKKWLTALVGIPTVVAFSALVGFTPSITRAAIMQILMMGANLLNRESDSLTSLSAACLCMLAVNPLVIESVSFQLSVACMLGIFLFAGPVFRWLTADKRLGRWKGRTWQGKLVFYVASGVSVSLSATVLTTPLTAFYFGTVSLIGLLTNLLTLWLINGIFYGCMVLCLLGLAWPVVGAWFGWLLAWPVRLMLAVADALARLPLAAVYTAGGYIGPWLVMAYLLLGVFLVQRKKQPLVLCCCVVLGLCTAVLAQTVPPYFREHQVTVVDVGQGQSVILRSGGKVFVVDCGGDDPEGAADCTAQMLLSQGISRIDALILTHSDKDHSGGAGFLLQRIRSEQVYAPLAAQEELALEGEGACYLTQDTVLSFPGGSLTLFAPESGAKSNDSSIAVLFQTENCDTLITGDLSQDAEIQLLRRVSVPQLDVLVVGHHGARNSTSSALLAWCQPQRALISVGEDNWYDHPHEETLERLRRAGCVIYRTDENGSITFWR